MYTIYIICYSKWQAVSDLLYDKKIFFMFFDLTKFSENSILCIVLLHYEIVDVCIYFYCKFINLLHICSVYIYSHKVYLIINNVFSRISPYTLFIVYEYFSNVLYFIYIVKYTNNTCVGVDLSMVFSFLQN